MMPDPVTPVSQYFSDHEKELLELVVISKYKFTARILYRFLIKSAAVSEVISTSEGIGVFYINASLMRILFEHIAVSYFVLLKFCDERNDNAGISYYRDYLANEYIERFGKFKRHKIIPSDMTTRKLNGILLEMIESKTIHEKDLQGVNQIGLKFSIPKIKNYIENEKPRDSVHLLEIGTMKSLMEGYSYLSSYVHGGPSADLVTFGSSPEQRAGANEEFATKSRGLVSFIRFMLVYFLSFENESVKFDLKKILEPYE